MSRCTSLSVYYVFAWLFLFLFLKAVDYNCCLFLLKITCLHLSCVILLHQSFSYSRNFLRKHFRLIHIHSHSIRYSLSFSRCESYLLKWMSSKSADGRVNSFQHTSISGQPPFCWEDIKARLEAQPGVINKSQKKTWGRFQRIPLPVLPLHLLQILAKVLWMFYVLICTF